MNINLAILYGIDDKYSIVEKTICRCKNYFDKILIINTGGVYTEQKLKNIDCHNFEIYNQDFLWGDTDSARRYALNLCNKNDWMFWLDSDECPSKLLLDNLKNIVNDAEKIGIGNIRFPSSNHIFDNINGSIKDISIHNPYKHDGVGYPYRYNVSLQNNTFIFNRMLKKIDGTYFISSCGGHSQFAQSNDQWIYSNYLINHYKSYKNIYISGMLHTWSSMRPNLTLYKDIIKLYNSEEYKIHMNFKKENDVSTTNKLVMRLLEDSSFKEKLKSCYYIDLFKNTKFDYRCIYEWISKYNMDITNNDGTHTCDLECCKY